MYSLICQELASFLKPLSISTSCTDIFEETLLKLASVQTAPTRCQFADTRTEWGRGLNDSKMYFKIWGITPEDAVIFLNYFKVTHGDASANKYYVEPPQDDCFYIPEDIEQDMFDMYIFEVNAEIVLNDILSAFKNEITRLQKESPEALASYQEKTRQALAVRPPQSLNIASPTLTPASTPSSTPASSPPKKTSKLGGIHNLFFSVTSASDDEFSEASDKERKNTDTISHDEYSGASDNERDCSNRFSQ